MCTPKQQLKIDHTISVATKCQKQRRVRLIGPIVAASLAAVFHARVVTYAGKPNGSGVPEEAIPVYAHPDMSLGNKIFEYLFPLIAPIGKMIDCPIARPDVECMRQGREFDKQQSAMAWAAILSDGYGESELAIERGDGSSPFRVILLRPPEHSGEPRDSAPLIFWMHGGGFTLGSARDPYIMHIMKVIRQSSERYPALRDAVWASVDYRLAPEHPFPAAQDDCRLALDYLLNNYTLDSGARLGTGGVHLAGVSAGATLAAKTALWSLHSGLRIDSILLDEPVFPTVSCSTADFLEGRCNPLDSGSYRRNAFTRIPPFHWIDWVQHAYTGCPPADERLEHAGQREHLCRDGVDFFSGTVSVDEWRAAKVAAGGVLPPVVILTAKFDLLHDLVVPFIEAYTKAAGREGVANLHRVDASTSHSLAFLFDPDAGRAMIDAWGGIIHSTLHRLEMETLLRVN